MQMRNLYLVFSVICLFVVTSCSNNIGNHDQTIEVQKHAGDNHYEDLKVITDKNKVLQVKKILNDTNFENKRWKCLVQLIISLFFSLKIRK